MSDPGVFAAPTTRLADKRSPEASPPETQPHAHPETSVRDESQQIELQRRKGVKAMSTFRSIVVSLFGPGINEEVLAAHRERAFHALQSSRGSF